MPIIVELNVKQLPPPEPMTNILKALAQLTEQQVLRVYHSREPFPLFEKLHENGWLYQCQKLSENDFVIDIYRIERHTFYQQMMDG